MSIVERIETARHRHLPPPATGRFKPLRAGIVNVWEYDQQEFWFADGRLVLRGQNTAGKSKALELLLPFVLDGDSRPERLDPFGNRSRTMYWNLIDFDDGRRSEIGYCWLEFGRVDDAGAEQYVTVIVGMRATRSSKNVEKWFAVTSARVGAEVNLAPDRRPLTRDRLREALGTDCVRESAHEHRIAVDRALYGLGPDRYDALIHLILQLRRPKLSEKLKPDTLAEHLADALPPLDRERVRKLAEAFARLDAEAAELEALEAAASEVRSFLDVYRDYARIHTRLRADAVRAASTVVHNVTRTEREQRDEHDAAREEATAVEARTAEVKTTISMTGGQLQGLDLTKVHALDNIVALAIETVAQADRLERAATDDESLASGAERDSADREARAAALGVDRDATGAQAAGAATTAGVGTEHAAHAEQLRAEPEDAASALDAVAERRRRLVVEVRSRDAGATEARLLITRTAEIEREARGRDALATDQVDATRAAVGAAADELAAAIDAWPSLLESDIASLIDRSLVDGATVVSRVIDADGSERPATDATAAALVTGRATLADQSRTLATRQTALTDGLATARTERDAVAAEQDDAPPASAGRAVDRDAAEVALWQCIDFAPGLDAATAAAVEAALHAAGLLDAVVTAAGLVDSATLDTVIVVDDRFGDSAARWLVVADGSPLSDEVVGRAVAAIGAGRDPERQCWIDVDGSWANGALAGRWSKPEAEFIGAAARAARRGRRLAALDARIDDLTVSLAAVGRDQADLKRRSFSLDEAARAFPSPTALAAALADGRHARGQLNERRRELGIAMDAVNAARQAGQAAIDALAIAEDAARCAATEVDDVLDAIDNYRRRVGAAVAAARAVLVAEVEVVKSADRAAAARVRANGSADDATSTRAVATQRMAEADELRRTSGAEVEALLARKGELENALDAARAELAELDAKGRAARDRSIRAETLLEEAVQRRVAAEEARTAALANQGEICATELAGLAIGVVDGRDVAQVTAGLAFARAVFDRLKDIVVDQRAQDEVDNRLHNVAYPRLRSQLASDFDPHLDVRDGLHVFVARLGGDVVGAVELDSALRTDVDRRRRTLTREERDIVDRHLVTELGTHLGERAHGAWDLIARMNRQLADHPTRSGVSLRLTWEPAPDLGPSGTAALRLLRQDVALLDATQRETLNAFLTDRVRQAREDAEGGDAVERLTKALDYRRWHTFAVYRRSPGGSEQRFTARTQSLGSGGEQAKLAHLPLFAAVAGYYASAAATAPHLLVLDEAFAGIDEDQRGDCMAMLVDLDLDTVLANYGEWGCYPQIPSVAVYHLERMPGRRGVAALRFVWDGHSYDEDDPYLDDQVSIDGGLFASSD